MLCDVFCFIQVTAYSHPSLGHSSERHTVVQSKSSIQANFKGQPSFWPLRDRKAPSCGWDSPLVTVQSRGTDEMLLLDDRNVPSTHWELQDQNQCFWPRWSTAPLAPAHLSKPPQPSFPRLPVDCAQQTFMDSIQQEPTSKPAYKYLSLTPDDSCTVSCKDSKFPHLCDLFLGLISVELLWMKLQ